MAAPSAPGVAATAWLRPSSAAQTRPHPLDCRGGRELEPASLLSATRRLGEPEREDTWPGRGGKLCAPLVRTRWRGSGSECGWCEEGGKGLGVGGD